MRVNVWYAYHWWMCRVPKQRICNAAGTFEVRSASSQNTWWEGGYIDNLATFTFINPLLHSKVIINSPFIGLRFPSMDPPPTTAGPSPFSPVPVPLDPRYKGFILIVVIAICFPLLLFFILLRSYVRIWVPRSFALDDGRRLHLQKRLFIYHY